LPFAVLALPLPALAQGFENLEMLDNRVAAALGANIGEPGGATNPVDRRLRLPACPQPVEIAEPAMGAITVRCQPLGWRIRVPLVPNGQAATAAAPAGARAAPTIRRGDQIELVAISSGFTVSTLAVAEQDGAPGDRIRVSIVPSAETRQAAAGAPAQRQARAEPVIRRGDQIELVAIASGFTVSTLATAEQDGAPGDRIRVRTENRSAPVIGLVLEDGRVALPGFN
jgi:flagella basal body P-ring formation protein FlgA